LSLIAILEEGFFRSIATSVINLFKKRLTPAKLQSDSDKYIKFSKMYTDRESEPVASVKARDLKS